MAAMAVLAASKSCPPVGAAVTCRAVAGKVAVEVSWGAATSLTLDSGKVGATTGPGASRWATSLIQGFTGTRVSGRVVEGELQGGPGTPLLPDVAAA